MSDYQVEIKVNPKLEPTLKETNDKILYGIARETLTQSETTIPMRTGKMRQSSMRAGVKGSNLDYYIGSYTSYAKHVWQMKDNTKWTTPGTNNRWFDRVWKTKGQLISLNVIERNKL